MKQAIHIRLLKLNNKKDAIILMNKEITIQKICDV